MDFWWPAFSRADWAALHSRVQVLPQRTFTPQENVDRARSRLDEHGQHLALSNCEHFAIRSPGPGSLRSSGTPSATSSRKRREGTASRPATQGPVSRRGQRDWRDNEGLALLVRDLKEMPVQVPKWMLLFGWFAPESAVAHCPALVATIARRALADVLASKPG